MFDLLKVTTQLTKVTFQEPRLVNNNTSMDCSYGATKTALDLGYWKCYDEQLKSTKLGSKYKKSLMDSFFTFLCLSYKPEN